MANLARSVVLNILGVNKQAKVAVDEANKWGDEIDARRPTMHIEAETKSAAQVIAELKIELGILTSPIHFVKVDVEDTPAIYKLSGLAAMLETLNHTIATPEVAIKGDAFAAIDAIMERMALLSGMIADPEVDINAAKVLAELTAIKAAIDSVKGKTVGLDVTPAGLDDMIASYKILGVQAAIAYDELESGSDKALRGLGTLTAAMDANAGSAQRIKGASNDAGNALSFLDGAVTRGTWGWGLLGGKVQLFGGLLTKIGIPAMIASAGFIHIIVDGLIEWAAVIIPAAIAFTAFAVTAGQGVQNIYQRMTALLVVSQSFNAKVGVMTEGFYKLQNAVQPQVYEVFGDALTIINDRTGLFTKLAEGAGQVVDNLAARMTLAITSAGGFGDIVGKHAIPDLQELGTLLGNLLGIFGNLAKSMPGIAEILLGLAVAFTHVIETVSGAIEPVLKIAIALHGFILWAGLATTVTFLLVRTIYNFGLALVGGIVKLYAWAVATVAASEGTGVFAGTMAILAEVDPLVWIAVAVVALGALIYEMRSASSGAKAFISSINTNLANDTASQAIAAISSDIGELNQRIAHSTVVAASFGKARDSFVASLATLGDNIVKNKATWEDWGHVATSYWHAVTANFDSSKASNDIKAYNGTIVSLTDDQKNLFKEVGVLMAGATTSTESFVHSAVPMVNAFNGVHDVITKTTTGAYDYSQALAIMDLAGVKASDSFATMQIKVEGLLNGYKAMGIQGGILGQAVNVITFATQQQDSKIATLTQAYTTFTQTISGSETAFVTFAQGLDTLHKNAAAAGASIDGLNVNSLALRQTFEQNVGAATAEYNALVLQASAAGNGAKANRELWQAGKDLVGTMLDTAKGSAQATAQLYALAQEAGYHGPDSFKALSLWVGNTNNSESNLNDMTKRLTVSSANLTKDVTNLATALSQVLNAAMSAAIFQADGGQKAFDKFATAVVNSKGQTDKLTPSAMVLAQQLIKTTGSTTDAHNEFDAFSVALGLSKTKADDMWNSIVHGGQVMDQQHAARVQFNADIQGIIDRSPTADADVNKLAQAIQNHGMKSSQAHNARAQLISDLEASGVKASVATRLVDNLAGAIVKLPSHKTLSLTESARGSWSLSQINASTGKQQQAAGGWLVPGWGGGDRHPALLEGGEAVVPKHLTHMVAPMLKAHGVPGFSVGGLMSDHISQNNLAGLSPWLGAEYTKSVAVTTKALENVAGNAAKAAAAQAGMGGAGSYSTANLINVGRYMFGHGYSRAAAAGIAAAVAGESGGNPEAAGSGGRGLIGWTPPSRLPNYAFTGNTVRDFNNQLPLILRYNAIWSQFIPLLNRQQSPLAAADVYSQYFERPAVLDSDVRSSVAWSVFAALGGLSARGAGSGGASHGVTGRRTLGNGGMITEPVMGMGMHSGSRYLIGERGPEMVTPMNRLHRGGGGDTYISITVQGDTNPDAAALRIIQKIRDFKRHHGNQPTNIG